MELMMANFVEFCRICSGRDLQEISPVREFLGTPAALRHIKSPPQRQVRGRRNLFKRFLEQLELLPR